MALESDRPDTEQEAGMIHPMIHQALANERRTQMRRTADQARISRPPAPCSPRSTYRPRFWIGRMVRVARA
jgi:hypothetical protein